MYQALYRKYRPCDFDGIVGQDVIKKTLENSILNNRISHAYLFTGPRGTGKTSIAKIFAKIVNCTNRNGVNPCNECVNCTQTSNKQTTDIIEIDAASNNGVDEIREIRNKVNLVPSNGKYKIYIIDQVHMLTTGAFNALLKTLEEPPSHVIFILATTEPHKIPSTILSRCQRYDFKKISSSSIKERLLYIINEEKINIEDKAIDEIARLSDGGMRDSISLLDQVIAYADEKITTNDVHEINGTISDDEISKFILNILEKDIEKLLANIDKFNDSGKNLIKIIEEMIEFLKNVLMYKISPNYIKNAKEEHLKYEELAKQIDDKETIEMIKKFSLVINDIKVSGNPKLAIELLILKECINIDNKTTKETIFEKTKEDFKKVEISNKSEKIVTESFILDDEIKKNEPYNDNKENNLNTKNDDNFNDHTIEKLKEIRINNTLARFNKRNLVIVKEKTDTFADYLLDDKYSKMASILVDGEVKAASDTNIVFVYKTSSFAYEFNKNIVSLQELVEKVTDINYKIIATDDISWEIIKKEFNNKTKTFDYIDEPKELEQKLIPSETSIEIEEMNNIFGDIVVYE